MGAFTVAEVNDWRLMNQEQFLQGATLHWSRWIRPRPDWDHDHCAFCWTTFMEQGQAGTLQYGCSTPDGYYWVCEQCFQDFRVMFRWHLEEEK